MNNIMIDSNQRSIEMKDIMRDSNQRSIEMKDKTMIPQYYVEADPDTGEWVTVPQFAGVVNQARWVAMASTPTTHYDIYEAKTNKYKYPLEDNNNELLTETRAIEIRWENRTAEMDPAFPSRR